MILPNVNKNKILAIDIETYDPDLKELGPGPRRTGYIIGVSIATNDQGWYFPLEHPDSENYPKDQVYDWLRELFLDSSRLWITANGMYDFDFLQYQVGIPQGKFFDIQWAQALLNEYQNSYSLETLSLEYLGIGKQVTEIDKYAESNGWKGSPQAYLYKMPATIVSPYAIGDAVQTYQIYEKQVPLLQRDGLESINDMENALDPLYLQMRRNGARVAIDKVPSVQKGLVDLYTTKKNELNAIAGFEVNVNAARSIEKLFQKLELFYGFTEKGNPSFASNFLETYPHEIAQTILEIRELQKLDSTFIESINRFQVNGRISSLFHPLRNGWNGTKSGRYANSLPNLQQIPSRSERGKNLIRGLFIPEDDCFWAKTDYSQIEYRIFAHYALGPKSEELRTRFNEDRNLDLHQFTASMVFSIPYESVTKEQRGIAKTINFGIIYGMGAGKLAKTLHRNDAESFLKHYHNLNPFMKFTMRECSQVAINRGYVKTILGRRARIPKELSYVALNRVVQGSAADVMKTGMLKAYEAGCYNVLTPHITVHDEMDVSVPKNKEGLQALQEQIRLFEIAIPFRVPILTETEIGNTWADCSKDKYKEFIKELSV